MNTETKHTPGPWLTYGDLITADDKLAPGYTCHVAIVKPPHDNLKHPPEEHEANKRLIASAPDMAKELAQLRADKVELVGSLEDFAYIAKNLPELSGFSGEPCDINGDLCGSLACENCGCINNKIHQARALITKHTKVTFGENGEQP